MPSTKTVFACDVTASWTGREDGGTSSLEGHLGASGLAHQRRCSPEDCLFARRSVHLGGRFEFQNNLDARPR